MAPSLFEVSMKKKSDYDGDIPSTLYVVGDGEKFRVYVYEGQAINWLTKQLKENKKSRLYRYKRDENA